MTHIFPYDPAYRFFRVKLSAIEGKSDRFTYIGFGTSSGAKGYRRSLNTSRPGIHTVEIYAIHPNYRTGKDTKCFITICCSGITKKPNGLVDPGAQSLFDWVRLSARPKNGLAVTLGDGSPLGETVKQGDTLRFEPHLDQPAQHAVVEAFVEPRYGAATN